jgi:hypothetical protein
MKTCPICQKELKHQGALNLHQWSCNLKNGAKQLNAVAVEKISETELAVKECVHNFRFLNLNAPLEKKAYFEGQYKEVCGTCQTLR